MLNFCADQLVILYPGGQAGTLKMTIPTAFSMTMLAWGMLEFPHVRALGLLAKLCNCRPHASTF